MDTTRADMPAEAKTSLDTQAIVFEGQANIYAPMYRQMNMAGLGLSESEAAPLQHSNRGKKIPAFIIKVTKRTFDE
jgi:hypothetical protein